AGAEQDAGRGDGAGREHDAVGADVLDAAAGLDVDADDSLSGEADTADQSLGADAQVGARAHRRRQVAAGRAHALAVDLVHRVRAGAGGRRVVVVGAARQAAARARVEEGPLPGDELLGPVAPDRDRPALTVPLVLRVEVVLQPPERGQTSLPRPLGQAERGPLVV